MLSLLNRIRRQTAQIWPRSLRLADRPPVPKIWEWAETHRQMGKDVTARPGRYSVSTAPYQKEPQEAFTANDVQTTVLYWAKRLGKTELINNLHGWVIACTARNILVVYPTLDSAKKWAKQFFMPMVRATRALLERVAKSKSRDSGSTILSKEFPGGVISAIGANSPSGFRQVQAPVVTCDEIDAMETGEEGDPVNLAFGRAENYSDCIQVVSSTATKILPPKAGETAGAGTGSRIHDFWLQSDQRKWFVPCPDCGHSFVLDDEPDFANRKLNLLKWPFVPRGAESKTGTPRSSGAAQSGVAADALPPHSIGEPDIENAYLECPKCRAHWDDAKRLQAVLAGEWRPTARFRGIRGYWLTGFNTVFAAKKGFKSKLHQFAAEFLEACEKGEAVQIVWRNTFLCKPQLDAAERLEASPLLDRVEKYSADKLPDQVLILGAAVDVQADRLEYEIVGMGEGEETWGVQFDKIIGDPEEDQVWDDLIGRLTQKFKRRDGLELAVTCTAIDLGHKPKRVRAFIKRCGIPRVYGVYGASHGKKQPHLVTPRLNKFYRMWSYSINTAQAKDLIFSRLKMKDPGPRYLHWHGGYGQDYFEGLTAEEKRVRYLHGFPETYYEKIRPRNEPLDLRVYFIAGMDILKPNLVEIKKNLEAGSKSAQKDYVMQAPSSKLQAPEKHQASSSKPKRKRMSMRVPGLGRKPEE